MIVMQTSSQGGFLMSYMSAEDKTYIIRKHKERVYEADTGLDIEEIKKGAEEFYALSDTENHAMLKAKVFDYEELLKLEEIEMKKGKEPVKIKCFLYSKKI